MDEMNELTIRIEALRNQMHILIEEKEILVDKEIIVISQLLDKLLNDYNKQMCKENKRRAI